VDIEPRNDYLVVERLPDAYEYGRILIPEVARQKGLKGRVLAVGPGKWVEGINGGRVRARLDVKPGDMVIFNSRWNDFAGNHEDELPLGAPSNLHLIQEADVFLKIKSNA